MIVITILLNLSWMLLIHFDTSEEIIFRQIYSCHVNAFVKCRISSLSLGSCKKVFSDTDKFNSYVYGLIMNRIIITIQLYLLI